jgi:hypothetical protein
MANGQPRPKRIEVVTFTKVSRLKKRSLSDVGNPEVIKSGGIGNDKS